MRMKKIYRYMLNCLVILFVFCLVTSKSLGLFAVIYSVIAVALIGQMWLSGNNFNRKLIFTLIDIIILISQQVFIVTVVYAGIQTGVIFILKRIIATLFILAPFMALYIHYLYVVQDQYFHSSNDTSVISYEVMKEIQNRFSNIKDSFLKSKDSLSMNNINEIVKDIPRHSFTRYVNKETLTEEYFTECEKSLDDEHLYIVISSTGSSASELISVFTQKIYNHVSLSFDSGLKTVISYNGGENVYPPGLNKEQLASFRKKDDASIIVYRLYAPRAKKKMVIDKIREINETGSAYNLVGLITKISLKPNIMFCSQFVYSILKIAGLEYFESAATIVKPTDLVEKDYYRKLEFCYEIKFNEISNTMKYMMQGI